MNQKAAVSGIPEHQHFSEFIKEDEANELLSQLSTATLKHFTAELDQAEADRIWVAAEQFRSEFGPSPRFLMTRMIELSYVYGKSGWRDFHDDLVRLSLQRYLDWCEQKLASLSMSEEDEVIERILGVIPIVIGSAEPDDTRKLTMTIAALPSNQTRMKLLNSIASLEMQSGNKNPILMLADSGNKQVSAGIRACWEARFNEKSNDRLGSWSDYLETLYRAQFPPVVKLLARHYPAMVMLEIGYSAGIRASTPGDVTEKLTQLGVRDNVDTFLPMGTLWYFLKQMHEHTRRHDQDAELSGLRAGVLGLVEVEPTLWVSALPWILLHAQSIKREVIAITCEIGRSNKQVAEVLQQLRDNPAVSTLAMGILALINGIDKPADQHTLALANSLAHYFDGTPKFPSPLTIRSATWLGSERLENYLRDCATRACQHFREHVRGRIGSQEEALTATLMNELLVQFRDSKNLATAARSESFGVPMLRLSQREIAKCTEETEYGCDLAFVVKAHAKDVYRMEWASLVQVKKTLVKRASASTTADTWKIDIAQLQTLIEACATSVYFLICAEGEVLVVPARHLMGYVNGGSKGSAAKSRTLGYNDIRSAAIPFQQYLVDLLVGQWIGTTATDTLEFINGNTSLKPRHILEVEIEFSPKKDG
jgi:hypothetical protein